MSSIIWNPWHGCIKHSEGCQNCYVYRRDESIGKDAGEVYRTRDFNLIIQKTRSGEYKVSSGTTVFLCMTSDFFIDTADPWRDEIWDMVRKRRDLYIMIITKRIERFLECIPKDWGDGWDHVSIGCTVENQKRCNQRMPIFLSAPIKHKFVICEPLIGNIDIERFLSDKIESLICGGESGPQARICDFNWVLSLREQCLKKHVKFTFKQTGAKFLKEGRVYSIPRKYQHIQAQKANIDC